ncbi:MAG: oligosaccharide flippase family protein [Clostridia bacterium]|nr:oligosaccharide flippase family protein [Clostridia bacterium]
MFKGFRKKAISKEVKASLAYTICSIIQKVLSIITTPLFARLLTVEQYGQLSIYNSWSAIITIFITLNLSFGSFNRAMVKYEDDRSGYISSIQTLVVGLGLVFVGIYLPFTKFFNNLLSLSTELVLLLVIEIIAQFGMSLWMGKNRYEFKYKSVVFVTILMMILSPTLALIFVLNAKERGIARILGYALIYIVIGGFFFIKNYFSGKKIFSKKYWKYALSFNIPLLVYYISQVIFNQSDRIMIEKFCGLGDAGLYDLAYTFALILTFVLNAINNSYIPWMYEKIKTEKHKDNRGMAIVITLIMSVLVGGVIWITPEAILLMGGKNYLASIYVVPPVALSLILLLYTSFFTNLQFYDERKYGLIAASIASAVANIILNCIFIPKFGFIVAGYTTFFSYILFCLCNYLVVRKDISKKGKWEGLINLEALILIFVFVVAMSYVGVILYPFIIARYVIIGLVILSLILFRKKVMEIGKKIIKNEINISIMSFARFVLRPFVKSFRKAKAKKYLKKKFLIKDKLQIMFICQCQHIWTKIETAVDVLSKNKNYEVTLLIVKDGNDSLDDTIFEKYAQKNGIKFIKYYKGVLKELKPNILFYPRPYDAYLPEDLRSYNAVKYSKLFYIPYGYSFMKLGHVNLMPSFTQNLTVLIADNEYAHNIFNERKLENYQFSYNLGCLYFENLLEENSNNKYPSLFNEIKGKKLKVMWTPRWVTDESIGGSNFFRYIDGIFDYLVENKDFKFVFRPHPFAFDNFIKKGLMTVEQKENYLKRLSESKNSKYDDTKEYLGTLLDTDVLITDVSSIIGEYALTGKPVIFCHNETHDILNETALKFCENVFYNAYNFDDIKNILDDLSKNKDPLKEKREKFCKEYKESFKGVNHEVELIVEEIKEKSFINKK